MRRCLVLLLAIVALCNGLACSREAATEPVPGVRLGMTPRDVRDRFQEEGTWQTKVGGGAGASDDTVVEWTARDGASHVRFEFHLGMLVAIRAHLREPIATERIESTAKTVTLRRPGSSGSDVTILARDCPTHKDEAEALVARAR
jgi:hypothetical protein